MLYLLIQKNLPWLQAHGLGFLRVFTFTEFQATIAVLVSFMLSLAFGQKMIAWLRARKFGDLATFDQAELDKLMKDKKGTPTMGGLLIISSIAVTTLLLADLTNFYVRAALVCLLWLGSVGAADDWLKLTAARRPGASRQGLFSIEKLLFQLTNAGQPFVHVTDSNLGNRGELLLEHDHQGIDLRIDWAREVLKSLVRVWRPPGEIHTKAENKPTLLRFDGKEHVQRPLR